MGLPLERSTIRASLHQPQSSFYKPIFAISSSGASGGGFTRTLDLGMARRVFYHCATPLASLCKLLPNNFVSLDKKNE
jgi:hypothetical protein